MESTNFGSLNLQIAKPGIKASTASTAEVYTTPTLNKFSMNSLASKKMQVQHGDSMTILVNEGVENIDQMYFLAPNLDPNSNAKLIAVNEKPGIGRTLNFNYSGVWSRVLQYATDAIEVSPEALVKMGLVGSKLTKGDNIAYSALKKVHFEVGDAMEVTLGEGDEAIEAVIYPLINSRIETYKPREVGKEEGQVEEGQVGDEVGEDPFNEVED